MASKPNDGGAFIRPKLCVLGVMFLWASQNQPPAFTTASLAIWGLSSVAVGLIAGAVCAFIQPLIGALGRASRDMADARANQVAAGLAKAAKAPASGAPAAGAREP